MKRVEQGVPLEALDLQSCIATNRAVELLSEIVVDVLGPVPALQLRAKFISEWNDEGRGVFVRDNSSDSGMEDDDDDDDDHWQIQAVTTMYGTTGIIDTTTTKMKKTTGKWRVIGQVLYT
jgi:hypothetical protein